MQLMAKPTFREYREAWAKLNPTQKARVILKQGQWEHPSGFAIFINCSSLFDPEREQDASELKACHALITERPELFPEEAASDG